MARLARVTYQLLTAGMWLNVCQRLITPDTEAAVPAWTEWQTMHNTQILHYSCFVQLPVRAAEPPSGMHSTQGWQVTLTECKNKPGRSTNSTVTVTPHTAGY